MNMQKRDEQIGEMLADRGRRYFWRPGGIDPAPAGRIPHRPMRQHWVESHCQRISIPETERQADSVSQRTRATTAQLAEKRGLSFELIDRQITDDDATFMVGVSDGIRSGYGIGLVALTGLRGEARANAIMKADTKARRRGVLDFCGLGMIDESEIGSVPGARPLAVDQATGEILDSTNAGRLAAGNSAPDYVAGLLNEAS